jgi:hypothetical protein
MSKVNVTVVVSNGHAPAKRGANKALKKINTDASKLQKTLPGISRQDAIKYAAAHYNKTKKH